jgi:hypothetical protein
MGMQMEIDNMLTHQRQSHMPIDNEASIQIDHKKARQEALQAEI